MNLRLIRPQLFKVLVASPSACQFLSLKKDYPHVFVEFSRTFQETVSAISAHIFGLILVDASLDDPCLIDLIKRSDGMNADTPIVMMIDSEEQNLRKACINAGFDDCLIKPLSVDNFTALIELWSGANPLAAHFDAVHTLLDKTKSNVKLVNLLYEKLFEELPVQIQTIESAIQSQNYAHALEVTHHLNGSAKTCYLKPIAETANALETCLAQNNRDYIEGYFLILKQRVLSLIKHREPILSFLNSEQ